MYSNLINKIVVNKHNIIRKILFFLVLIISIYFISLLYFNFKTDEDVSMGLMQHNYYDIIRIDSLDVHPPLYYLLLRFFVQLTTFWTKSLFIKTILARLFSTILLISFVIIMLKIVENFNININCKWQIILFLMVPGIINESTKIRMYSLGAFLLSVELYELIKFYQDNRNTNIILATIFASLASYTLYPLAISAGLFLLLFFIFELFKYKNVAIKIFISGIVLLLLYMPWLPILINQMTFHAGSDNVLVSNYFYNVVAAFTQLNAPSPQSLLLKYISIASLIVITLFIYIVKYIIKNLNAEFDFKFIFIITTINFIVTLILSLIFSKRQFRPTVTYPIFSITMFLVIIVIIKKYQLVNILNKNHLIFTFLSVMSLLIFVGYMGSATIFNVKGYDIPSIKLIKNMHNWTLSDNNSIDLSKTSSIRNQSLISTTEANQDSIYLTSIGKKAIIPNNKINIYDFANSTFNNKHSTKLVTDLFNNLYFYNP